MNSKKSTFTILSLFMIIFCIGADTFLISPLIPLLTEELNISVSQGGLLSLSYALAYALFCFILGPISDRLGRRKTLLAGILCFTLFSFFCAFAWSFHSLIFFRALSGIAAAAAAPQVWALIGDRFPFEKRGRIVGIVTSALAVSQIVGLPAGSFIAKAFSWNYSFIFLGTISLITSVIAFFCISEKEIIIESKRSFFSILGTLHKVFENRQVFSALMVTFFMMFGSFGLFTFIGAWLSQSYSLDIGQIGTVMIAIGLGNMAGQLSGGIFSDKYGKRKVSALFMPIMAFMLLLLPQTHYFLPVSIIVLLLWFYSAGISLSSFNAYVTELMPTQRGTLMSVNSSFMYMGTSAGVAINSLLLKRGNFSMLGISSFSAVIIAWGILSILLKGNKEMNPKRS